MALLLLEIIVTSCVPLLENCTENPEISAYLFSKLVLTHNEFLETVLTGKSTRLELSIDILFVSKFVVYCPG